MNIETVILGFSFLASLGCSPLKMGPPADPATDSELIRVTQPPGRE
jgi:hypothetical protein